MRITSVRKGAVAAALVALLAAIGLAVGATPAHASFVSQYCNDNQVADDHVRRVDAEAYAAVADNEGYEWGGGCWNDNNRDDTPGAPDSNGEGPDCSGYVYKSWELKYVLGSGNGFTWHDKLQNAHGQYTSDDFHSPQSGDPFTAVSKSSMMYMDAYAKNGHVAMLSSHVSPHTNTRMVWEALGDASGTDLNEEGYNADGQYSGVRRNSWTPDCYPNCGLSDPLVVVP